MRGARMRAQSMTGPRINLKTRRRDLARLRILEALCLKNRPNLVNLIAGHQRTL